MKFFNYLVFHCDFDNKFNRTFSTSDATFSINTHRGDVLKIYKIIKITSRNSISVINFTSNLISRVVSLTGRDVHEAGRFLAKFRLLVKRIATGEFTIICY